MELRLLGPVELVDGNRSVDLGGPRKRIVIAMLGLNANRVVSVDHLVDAVWDVNPPSTARSQIQICISSLRRVFTGLGRSDAIRTRPPGYLLDITADELDLMRFTELGLAARADAEAGRHEAVAEGLRAAVALWRGDALSGIDSELVSREAALLDDRRLTVVEECIRHELALGRHDEVDGELRQLIGSNPLRERLYGFLMLALYRQGRQAEALEVGRRARSVMIEEVGLEPGQELQDLEQAILTRDPSLELPRRPPPAARPPAEGDAADTAGDGDPDGPGPAAVTHAVAVPHQLPASILDFTGRSGHLDDIKRALEADTTGERAFGVPIVAISGRGGVGKSSLAVRAAHELADDYPDGHLYSDMSPGRGETVDQALVRFLRALGVNGNAIPEDRVERESMYRTCLSDRRVLLVLDGVGSEEDVLPLLPGNPSCGVITTSRVHLGGLPGAHWVDVATMSRERAVELIGRIVGPARIEAEADAVTELVRFCEGLPLALRIAGSRLASRPRWRISALVDRLRDEAGRLDEFAHHGLELRSSIRLTHRALGHHAQRLLRLVALVPSKEFALWTAAALLDVRRREAEDILESLVDAQLLDIVEYAQERRVRYRMHDLIRVFAREQLLEHEEPAARDQALDRMLGGWMALSEDAHRVEYGGDHTVLHGSAARWRAADRDPEDIGVTTAMPWWEDERSAITAALKLAAETGRDELCWDLALTSVTLFEAKAYFDDWRDTTAIALEVCRRAGNRTGEAAMLYSAGTRAMYQTRLTEADEHLGAALEIFTADGNAHGRALVLRNLAHIDAIRGATEDSVARYTESLATMRAVGDRVSEAHILRNLSRHHLLVGEIADARARLDDALAVCRDVRCLRIEAQILLTYAQVHMAMHEFADARDALNRVLRFVRGSGDRIGEAHVLHELGTVQFREGRSDSAEITLGQALELSRRVGEQDIEAKALVELGHLALAGGRTGAAVTHLRAARRLAEQLGYGGVLERAEELLAEAGEDKEPADDDVERSPLGPGGLLGGLRSMSDPAAGLLPEPRPT